VIQTCKHCGELFVGNAYRVTSEEDGETLLDMVVCSLCAMEAKRLQLHTEEINVSNQHPSVQEPIRRRSRFEI
jgi:RNase P subunit RPR2